MNYYQFPYTFSFSNCTGVERNQMDTIGWPNILKNRMQESTKQSGHPRRSIIEENLLNES